MPKSSEAPIPETMEGLRRQNGAYRSLCASLEAIQATQTDFARRCHDAEMTLDSERAANEILTAQVERLQVAADCARRFLRNQDGAGFGTTKMEGGEFYMWASCIASQLDEALS